MKEELLHFIWKYAKFPLNGLSTVSGETLSVKNLGRHNHLAGPDFLEAQIWIGGQLWAGSVEIHVKSSDWFRHNHQSDTNYNNVILHVVWEDDLPVTRPTGEIIPTLQLAKAIPKTFVNNYCQLMQPKSFVNCETDLHQFNGFDREHWLERVFFERFETKAKQVYALLEQTANNWEQLLFLMLLKGFGTKVNGEFFLQQGLKIPVQVWRSCLNDPLELEALFFGTMGMFSKEVPQDTYFNEQSERYAYLKHKFRLQESYGSGANYYGLRPPNFPTLRLAQLSRLLCREKKLFRDLMHTWQMAQLKSLLQVRLNGYWASHFVFGKSVVEKTRSTTDAFLELLLVNTVIPLKFAYAKYKGQQVTEKLLELVMHLKPEKNTIISRFAKRGWQADHALHTQALIGLYAQYCQQHRCLQCAVGSRLLHA